ncbi:MAG: hypothetical protein KAS72_08815 [Phycisphaerales bacterium]|nr:hypothetical protein [Phycisphaerales bacterium]
MSCHDLAEQERYHIDHLLAIGFASHRIARAPDRRSARRSRRLAAD